MSEYKQMIGKWIIEKNRKHNKYSNNALSPCCRKTLYNMASGRCTPNDETLRLLARQYHLCYLDEPEEYDMLNNMLADCCTAFMTHDEQILKRIEAKMSACYCKQFILLRDYTCLLVGFVFFLCKNDLQYYQQHKEMFLHPSVYSDEFNRIHNLLKFYDSLDNGDFDIAEKILFENHFTDAETNLMLILQNKSRDNEFYCNEFIVKTSAYPQLFAHFYQGIAQNITQWKEHRKQKECNLSAPQFKRCHKRKMTKLIEKADDGQLLDELMKIAETKRSYKLIYDYLIAKREHSIANASIEKEKPLA